MRRTAVVAVLFSLVSGLAWTAAWARGDVAPGAEATFVGRIGDERTAASLGGLRVADDLVDVARRHAQEMADQQRLFHNDRLATDVSDWQKVGENVGRGSSVEEIHQAFMASAPHRANILDRDFTEVGVGVVADGADLWVVEVFRLPKAAPSSGGAAAGTQSSPTTTAAPPTTAAPQPRPRSTGDTSGASGSGVRAASSSSSPPSTSAPSANTDPSAVVTADQGPGPETVDNATAPSTVPGAPAVAEPFDRAEHTRPSTAAASSPASSVVPTTTAARARATHAPAAPRDVTLPIGLAAGMLVLVVGGLAWQVAGERVRATSGRRASSLVDLWELALA